MKKILAISVGALLSAYSVSAQVTNSPINFIQQAAQWATSLDTNKSWDGIKLQFEDGLNQVTGQGASDYIRGQYNINSFNLAIEGDFFGVGSSFNEVEGGFGYALVSTYDFKIEANVLAGGLKIDSTSGMRFVVEPEIKLTKLMTRNTYTTMSMSFPWIQSKAFDGTPSFRVGMGFTF
jgi:hypothetical protein